jgi:hypothetical protein
MKRCLVLVNQIFNYVCSIYMWNILLTLHENLFIICMSILLIITGGLLWHKNVTGHADSWGEQQTSWSTSIMMAKWLSVGFFFNMFSGSKWNVVIFGSHAREPIVMWRPLAYMFRNCWSYWPETLYTFWFDLILGFATRGPKPKTKSAMTAEVMAGSAPNF